MPKKITKYIINNQSVPGVTTILGVIDKPGLNNWRVSLGQQESDRVSREAKAYGDKLHAVIEQITGGQEIKLDDDMTTVVDNFKIATENWKFLDNEVQLLNKEILYGGTCDAIVEIDGAKYLIDYKTSSDGRAWPEHELQVVAYMECLPDVKNAIIMYLNKKTLGWQDVHVPHTIGTFNVFLAALEIYKWRQSTNN